MSTTLDQKTCTKCGAPKPLSEYYITKNRHGNRQVYSRCKPCHREDAYRYQRRDSEEFRAYRREYARRPYVREKNVARQREKLYGVSDEQYKALVAAQGGRCAICTRLPGKRELAVDHDHDTNLIRELLCVSCNLGLGYFGDDPDLLLKAVTYLRKHHQQRLRVIK
jgi:hypothetical protein